MQFSYEKKSSSVFYNTPVQLTIAERDTQSDTEKASLKDALQ